MFIGLRKVRIDVNSELTVLVFPVELDALVIVHEPINLFRNVLAHRDELVAAMLVNHTSHGSNHAVFTDVTVGFALFESHSNVDFFASDPRPEAFLVNVSGAGPEHGFRRIGVKFGCWHIWSHSHELH